MLDDENVIRQRDPSGSLGITAKQFEQTLFTADVHNSDHDNRSIKKLVIAGMGGSALSALLIKSWLNSEITIPFEIVRDYALPGYVDGETLVIASSYSGNTEETVSALNIARQKGAEVAVVTSGGKLLEMAKQNGISHVILPSGFQPRVAVFYSLRGMVSLLVNFGITSSSVYDEISGASEWLGQETSNWLSNVNTAKNYAKQLALLSVGKTAVFYGGSITSPVAYKWKISWNENAKNVSFYNQYPEFNHNEFIGWTSHPIEKPFVIFDIISSFENSQILKRFEISDRLLSGQRPKSNIIELKGDTVLKQLLWGSVLADFTSIYLAILNGVDPTPVPLIEKLKKEL